MPDHVRCCEYGILSEIDSVSAERSFERNRVNDASGINTQIIIGALRVRHWKPNGQDQRNQEPKIITYSLQDRSRVGPSALRFKRE